MKKLILLVLLISGIAKAQTFDFSCGPEITLTGPSAWLDRTGVYFSWSSDYTVNSTAINLEWRWREIDGEFGNWADRSNYINQRYADRLLITSLVNVGQAPRIAEFRIIALDENFEIRRSNSISITTHDIGYLTRNNDLFLTHTISEPTNNAVDVGWSIDNNVGLGTGWLYRAETLVQLKAGETWFDVRREFRTNFTQESNTLEYSCATCSGEKTYRLKVTPTTRYPGYYTKHSPLYSEEFTINWN